MENLLQYRFNKYTSTGNDGIIEFIFRTLGIHDGFFVEFGAWDGLHGCNCRKLWEEGWSGIFIEPVLWRFLKLYLNYWRERRITCLCSKVGLNQRNFDRIIEKHVQERHIDFCSIDIDGLDLEVFETFEQHLPTVVCMEGGQMLHPLCPRIPVEKAAHNIQQSLSVIMLSAEKKGYKLLCSYQDTFLIRAEYYDRFEVSDDLYRLYFDGLKAHHRRLPWIQKKLREVKLRNPIVDGILKRSCYAEYGFEKRNQWAVDFEDKILNIIEEQYAEEVGYSRGTSRANQGSLSRNR